MKLHETVFSYATSRSTWIGGVLVGMATTAVATVLGFVLERWLKEPDVAMMQLLGIVVVAMGFPVGPAVASAVVSVLSFDYFFIPPRFAFAWADTKSSITFLVMVITGAAVSHVNQRLRLERRRAAVRERTTAALYRLSNDLGAARSLRHASAIASRDLSDLFGAPVVVVLCEDGALGAADLSGDDKSHAEECWHTLSPVQRAIPRQGESIWVPIISAHRPTGVLGVRTTASVPELESPTKATLDRCAQVLATAVERIELADAARRAELRVEVEQLRNSLLSAVSHDIRTPLASIVASGGILAEWKSEISRDQHRLLALTIVEEAERLTRLTENLLELARLRTGQVALKREAVPVDELVEAALRRLQPRLKGRSVEVTIPEQCPLVAVDRLLIEQVLVNLLENSSKYAMLEASIEVAATYDSDAVTISVADRGPGLPAGEEERIFERFYRGSNVNAAGDGLGLGLTIARAIVESHGGMIRLENRAGGGVVARVRLPRAQGIDVDQHDEAMAADDETHWVPDA